MADEAGNRGAFLIQEHYCTVMGAPITARVCRALSVALTRDTRTGTRALDWAGEPTADALPLRTAGGFHALHLAGVAPALSRVFRGEVTDADEVAAVIGETLAAHDDALLPWLDGPPQTNEPGRSAALMTGLMAVAARFGQPLELLEIGSSAGLNLMIDRYRFDLGGVMLAWEEATRATLAARHPEPPAPVDVRIASVRGVDIQPIDVRDPARAERLEAYVWVDTPQRLERLRGAIAMANEHAPDLVQGDAAEWIADRLAEPQVAGKTRVLMHSVVWQYLGAERQAAIREAMATAGAAATEERPLAWVRMEPNRQSAVQEVWVRTWPDGAPARRVAFTHAHGTWIEPAEAADGGGDPAGADHAGYWTEERLGRLKP